MTKRKWNNEEFKEAVVNNTSLRQTLISLGLCAEGGGNYKLAKRLLKELNISTTHWLGKGHLKGKAHNWNKRYPPDEIFVENSKYASVRGLKKLLLKEKKLETKCYGENCSLTQSWLGKPLILHLDHINGNNIDNRIENLRFLCPNCHSQTPTYCGKNKKLRTTGIAPALLAEPGLEPGGSAVPPRPQKYCLDCQSPLKTSKGSRCITCFRKILARVPKKNKIIWPLNDELKERLKSTSYVRLGKELGVSDNAIRKHLKLPVGFDPTTSCLQNKCSAE